MKRYINYIIYVLKHKYYVFLACRHMRVPLLRSILHDWSKFTIAEFSPYAINFFNKDGTRMSVRNQDGSYDPNSQSISFKYAWLNHQKNKHHWQAWVSIGDGGNLSLLNIPETYLREMIADWSGAGMAISGISNPTAWYYKNRDKILLNNDSRLLLETLLNNYYKD